MQPGTKVLVFGQHAGVVLKGKPLEGHVLVQWRVGATAYRAYIALSDVSL